MQKAILLTLAFLGILHLSAQNQQIIPDNNVPRILQIDQVKLQANLSFAPEKGLINGSVKLSLVNKTENLDSLWLDGIRMNILKMSMNNMPVTYKIYQKGLALFFEEPLKAGEEVTLEYLYTATPRRGMYFIGWNDPENKARKQIWTQGQGIDNRHWIPHVDAQNDKLITALNITFPKDFVVVSNGKLKAKESYGDDQNVWKYEMIHPHSSYLMMIAIGELGELKQYSTSNIELQNFYYPDWQDRNQWTYYKNKEIFDFLEKEIGVPYPWSNYKQVPVVDFQHGAMENTSSTIFGDFYCTDEISFNDDPYVRINAHELTHQWFGNMITSLGAHDHWLHEGFATYYSWLAEEMVFGADRLEEIKIHSQNNILLADDVDKFPLAHSKAGSARFYDKGAWVLYMLRKKIGDEAFKSGIKSYLERHAFSIVETDDFKVAMEDASTMNLDNFFNQWVLRVGIPKMHVKIAFNEENDNLTVTVTQKQHINSDNRAYHLDLPLVIKTNLDTYHYSLKMTDKIKRFALAINPGEEIEYVIIDPNHEYLCQWKWEMPGSYITNYLMQDTLGVQSAYMFNSLDKPVKADLKWLKKMNYANWPEFIQEEFMDFMVVNEKELDEKWFLEKLKESKRDAKLVYLKKNNGINKKFEKELVNWLSYPSYSVQAETLLNLGIAFPDHLKNYIDLTKDVYGTRGNNVRIYWHMLSILDGDKSHMDEWIDMTSIHYDFFTRMNAFDAFAILGYYMDDEICSNLFQAVFQGNRKLRGNARRYLQACWDLEEKQKVILAYISQNKSGWEEWQHKTVNGLFDLDKK